MIRTALTGNIGSGKTLVAEVIRHLGHPVYTSDREAARIMQQPGVIMHLSDRFGTDILTYDGLVDRRKMADIVFRDPAALNWLNYLMHPLVMDDWNKWCLKHSNCPMVVMESAIVFEHGLQEYFDRVILVDAPEEVMVERVMQRDNVTRDEVLSRMQHQWSSERKRELTPFVIRNDGSRMLLPEILRVLANLQEKPAGIAP
jgi:dephospho-CoA kinase